ncbi:hypothetical protein SeLEV6574_g04573 [Synchytrium endobioticum]|uniref:Prolyl endopeptidase-like n=1 Tax=Synchytrium endobioticum TaxID=286115 RepID=A0A507CYS3_9FUNG|nr:hypothetical protein SeLEV6574_g04573 [Synchytrium endobioticum]
MFAKVYQKIAHVDDINPHQIPQSAEQTEWAHEDLARGKQRVTGLNALRIFLALAGAACGTLVVLLFVAFMLSKKTPSGDYSNGTTFPASPPIAKKRPSTIIVGDNVTIQDDYAWFKYRDDPNVIDYIHAENDYTTYMMGPTKSLQKTLVKELTHWNERLLASMKSGCDNGIKSTRIWEFGDYVYWVDQGSYKRRKINSNTSSSIDLAITRCACPYSSSPTSDEVLLDLNDAAPRNSSYFSMGVFEVSPLDPNLIAYSFDTKGNEAYTIRMLNASSKQYIGASIPNTYYTARWFIQEFSDGNATSISHVLYYNVVDPILGIPNRIYRYTLGGIDRVPGEDLVYVELDYRYIVEMGITNDGFYVFIKVSNLQTSEIRVVSPTSSAFQLTFPREEGISYDLEHRDGHFYLRTNAGGATEFQIIRLSAIEVLSSSPQPLSKRLSQAQIILPHDPHRFIERMEVFASHLVAWVWSAGLREIVVVALNTLAITNVSFASGNPASQVYSLFPSTITDMESRLYRRFNTSCLLYSNSSYMQPMQVYSMDMRYANTSYLVSESVVSNYNPEEYFQDRIFTTSTVNNETKVPISLFRRRNPKGSEGLDVSLLSPRSLLMLAYGAYGTFIETGFSVDWIPLLDRGIVIAQCHPRGDGDLGSKWYEGGRKLNKTNTFLDVQACLHEVIARGITNAGMIALKGRSAGGLVTGVAVNEWGWFDDYESGLDTIYSKHMVKAVVAQVPFIDVVGDLSDELVPWTPYEWNEWGNPNATRAPDLEYQLSYSPYQRIPTTEATSFPALYVSTGVNDPRVPYWEPVKWIAKLRSVQANRMSDGTPICTNSTNNTTGRPLLLRVDSAGHFGSSGASRIEALAEWKRMCLQILPRPIKDPQQRRLDNIIGASQLQRLLFEDGH